MNLRFLFWVMGFRREELNFSGGLKSSVFAVFLWMSTTFDTRLNVT
jgi:hypothetical protein